MNGNWFSWGAGVNGNTPAGFVAAWRHVHRVFAQEGARNVSWIWSINNLESAGAEAVIAEHYPGDPYVDWVATSGFNWGEAYDWSSWRDADSLYGTTYRALARLGKPIMISEIATTDLGGDPEGAWIPQTLAPAGGLPAGPRGGLVRRHRRGRPRLPPARRHDPGLASRAAVGEGWLQDPNIRYLAP